MSITLSPIVSEFETTEQETSYATWLRAKVQASLADPRPTIPHDAVMAEIDALIDEIARLRADALPIDWRSSARDDLHKIIGHIARNNPAAAHRMK